MEGKRRGWKRRKGRGGEGNRREGGEKQRKEYEMGRKWKGGEGKAEEERRALGGDGTGGENNNSIPGVPIQRGTDLTAVLFFQPQALVPSCVRYRFLTHFWKYYSKGQHMFMTIICKHSLWHPLKLILGILSSTGIDHATPRGLK